MNYGRYRIVSELGKGSMGVVYQAHDPHIDRQVALKVLRSDKVGSDAFVQRFIREAKAIGRLSHPGIVVVYDIGEDRDTVYISMELIEGEPLSSLIRDGRFTPEDIIGMGIKVAGALDYAHRKGIIHRDIKPSNIIVQPDSEPKITDFGIAHIEDPEATQQTQAGEILGTPAYMSPEQVLGRHIDGRSDIFSLGVILYEVSAGKRPFPGDNMAAVFHAITTEEPPAPASVNSRIPPELSQVIMKCLAKDPAARYSTGRDLADALSRCREVLGEKRPARPVAPGRKSRSLAVATVFLILSCAAAIAYFLVPQKAVPPGKPPSHGVQGDLTGKADVKPPGIPEDKPSSNVAEKPGFLKVETVPPGASVLVDGRPRGFSPLRMNLSPGPHEVKLVLSNYGDWEAQVKISEDKETHLPIELLPVEDQPR